MSEATREGADIDTAAQAFEGLLDAPAEPSVEPEEAADEPVEEPEAEVEGEAEEEATDDAEETPEEPAEEDEGVELDPSGLAQLIGVDEDAVIVSDDGVKFRTKIDGEEGQVSLKDLLKSYQLEGHVNKRSMELAEQRKALEEQAAAARRVYEERIKQAEALVESVEQSLLAEYNAINWAELRETDPAEYAAKRQEFAERAQAIEQAKARAAQGRSELSQEEQERQRQQLQEYLQQEAKRLYDALPEWSDEGKRKEEQSAIREYLKGIGFSDQEIAQAYDHRVVLMARDAMRYRQMQSKKPAVSKKVAKAPKLLKPGAKKDKEELAAERAKAIRNKLKKTGSVDDAAALFLQSM